MLRTIERRDGNDGPAKFYLKEIEKARATGMPKENWTGAVSVDAK